MRTSTNVEEGGDVWEVAYLGACCEDGIGDEAMHSRHDVSLEIDRRGQVALEVGEGDDVAALVLACILSVLLHAPVTRGATGREGEEGMPRVTKGR